MKLSRLACGFTFIVSIFLLSQMVIAHAAPVSRDHLTEKEIELVQGAQEIDIRVAVFIHAIERRFMVLTDPNAAASPQVRKESEKWGDLPSGSRADLIGDIAKILDEAITNIDDVSSRDDENKKHLGTALHKLGEAAARFVSQLEPMREKAADGPEREPLEQAIESAKEIVDAASKLPPDPTPTPKSRKKNGDG